MELQPGKSAKTYLQLMSTAAGIKPSSHRSRDAWSLGCQTPAHVPRCEEWTQGKRSPHARPSVVLPVVLVLTWNLHLLHLACFSLLEQEYQMPVPSLCLEALDF